MLVRKFVFCMFFGLYVTIVLLFIMQSLIYTGEKVVKEDLGVSMVEFVQTRDIPKLTIKERNPHPPPSPGVPPPQAAAKLEFHPAIVTSDYTVNNPVLEHSEQQPVGPGLMYADGDYLPIVQVQPVYPRSALMKGLVGWVIVEFTVTERGRVEDPHIVSNCAVVQPGQVTVECVNHPNRIFDTAAIRAAFKFKFKPRIINGIASATAGVKNLITFELND